MRKRFDTPEAEPLSESGDAAANGHQSSIRPASCPYCGRVLIIDDCAEARSITAALLRLRGFDAIEAVDGDEGIALYRVLRGAIDVVLLDMQMPGLNGIETFCELKQLNWAVKGVLFSGALSRVEADEALEAGIITCLAKPADADLISNTLLRAMGKKGPTDASEVESNKG